MGKGKCVYCGRPAARQAEGVGRRGATRIRAWCSRCLKAIEKTGVAERADEYPSWSDSVRCGAYEGRLSPVTLT